MTTEELFLRLREAGVTRLYGGAASNWTHPLPTPEQKAKLNIIANDVGLHQFSDGCLNIPDKYFPELNDLFELAEELRS